MGWQDSPFQSSSISPIEDALLTLFRVLNNDGQQKLMERAEELRGPFPFSKTTHGLPLSSFFIVIIIIQFLFISFIGSFVLVGHNVNFDINFIYDNLLKLNGMQFKNNFPNL